MKAFKSSVSLFGSFLGGLKQQHAESGNNSPTITCKRWTDAMCSHFWHGGLGCCISYQGRLVLGACLIPAHYPGPSQLSSSESPGATAPAAREIQMFPVNSDGKSYKTLICNKKEGIK